MDGQRRSPSASKGQGQHPATRSGARPGGLGILTMLGERPRLRFLGKLLVTVGAITLLLSTVGWEGVARALATVALIWLGVSYALNLARRWIDAAQMAVILRLVGLRVGVGRVFMANVLSTFYDLILPGGIVATGAKWLNLSGATGERPVTLNAVLFNRVVLLAPTFLFGCLALAWENPTEGAALPVALAVILVFVTCLAAFAYHPRLGKVGDGAVHGIAVHLPRVLARPIAKLLDALPPFRALRASQHLLLFGIATCGFLLQVLSMWFATLALHLDVPILVIAWAHALLALARQVPLTVGNFGIREALLVLALSPYGVDAEMAVALGLLSWSKQVVSAIVGGGYQVALTLGWARWKAGPVSAPAPRPQNVEVGVGSGAGSGTSS